MHAEAMPATSHRAQAATWKTDLALSLVPPLMFACLQAFWGFPALNKLIGDTDSLLRLVEVRDLISGQGWFDLHQYRMGPAGGFVMHWSRLVDAPVAAIMLAATALTGNPVTGEIVGQIIWPALLMAGCMFALLRLARLFAGTDAVMPVLVIGAIGLHILSIFTPGALDHHNIQLVLCLTTLWLLASGGPRMAAGAGVCSALMLGIGMETAPYVAVAGLCVAGNMLTRGTEGCRDAIGYGLGFAGAATILLISTVPSSAWSSVECDAYSAGQFGAAALAGVGISLAAAATANHGTAARVASLALLGAVMVSALLIYAPQCLASPYGDLDPRLVSLWLDYIAEAQPLWRLPHYDPSLIALRYATPFIAVILMLAAIIRGPIRRIDLIVFSFLAMAIAVSVWQVRGSTFSVVIAMVPLAAWIARWCVRAAARQGWATAGMIVTWLASMNLVWGLSYIAISEFLFNVPVGAVADAKDGDISCEDPKSYAPLAEQPAGMVLAISNLGSAILAYTPQRALYGTYHRNRIGNVDALKSLIGTDAEAESTVRRHGVTLIAVCPGNPESDVLTKAAPTGFLANISGGRVPGWLEPVATTANQPLRLFRVR